MEEKKVKDCPEFPFFGASYPDATCIDGVLYDLDDCDENGNLYEKEGTPCPFCRTEAFLEWEVGSLTDFETEEEYKHEIERVSRLIEKTKEKHS